MSDVTRFNCQNVVEFMGHPMSFAEERQWRQHVESCPDCMARVEAALSSTTVVEELRYLVPDAIDNEFEDNLRWSNHDFVVDYLDPAQDPASLGSLGAHYDIVEIIGHGGMGIVMKAYDRALKRFVAIKALSPHLASSPIARRRFARESQSAAAVVHPNVIQIHSVEASGRLPFLVMELISGESLADRLKRQGSFELKDIVQIGSQIAAGLAAAHDQGLVHRDIKPSNILIEDGGRAVLTDFGLARSVNDTSLTRTSSFAGTPEYISPEAANGKMADHRSDLFSLGCVLYSLASGVSPFRADSMFAVLRHVSECAPQPLASFCTHLPTWFTNLVHRLLEKDPADRIQTANEVVQLLEAGLAHLNQPDVIKPPSIVTHRRVRLPIRTSIAGAAVAIILTVAFCLNKNGSSPLVDRQQQVAASSTSRLEDSLKTLKASGAKLTELNNQVVMVDFKGASVTQELIKSLKDIPSLQAIAIQQPSFPSSWFGHIPKHVYRLDIFDMNITKENCAELSKHSHLSVLGFINSTLPENGIQTACAATAVEQLTLQQTPVDESTVKWLVQTQTLKLLDLNGNTMLNARVIESVSQMKSLCVLHLGDTQVDDAAIDKIAANLPLKELGLARCSKLTDKGLQSIAQCKTLEAVYLDSTPITEEGITQLASLPNLSKLFVRDNAIDKQRLQRTLGIRVVIVDRY